MNMMVPLVLFVLCIVSTFAVSSTRSSMRGHTVFPEAFNSAWKQVFSNIEGQQLPAGFFQDLVKSYQSMTMNSMDVPSMIEYHYNSVSANSGNNPYKTSSTFSNGEDNVLQSLSRYRFLSWDDVADAFNKFIVFRSKNPSLTLKTPSDLRCRIFYFASKPTVPLGHDAEGTLLGDVAQLEKELQSEPRIQYNDCPLESADGSEWIKDLKDEYDSKQSQKRIRVF